MNKMDTTVTSEDLNLIDAMNGQAAISQKGDAPIFKEDADGTLQGLKGALAQYNGFFSKYKEMQFIKATRDQIYEYLTERFIYNDLPDGLTKYRLELKLIENGSCFVIKIGEEFFALNYTIITNNIYDEPVKIIVNEPKSELNGKEYNLAVITNGIIMRNTQKKATLLPKAYRYIDQLEKILFQMEKNLLVSAPKGIINTQGKEIVSSEPFDSPYKNSLEHIINSQDTFFELRTKDIEQMKLGDGDGNEIFIPLEFTDRTESLLRQYAFIKEQLKELMGATPNMMQGKKERTITSEIEPQDSLASTARQHAFNIREIDLDKLNKMFNLNITIEYQSDIREEIEQEEIDNEEDIDKGGK